MNPVLERLEALQEDKAEELRGLEAKNDDLQRTVTGLRGKLEASKKAFAAQQQELTARPTKEESAPLKKEVANLRAKLRATCQEKEGSEKQLAIAQAQLRQIQAELDRVEEPDEAADASDAAKPDALSPLLILALVSVIGYGLCKLLSHYHHPRSEPDHAVQSPQRLAVTEEDQTVRYWQEYFGRV